MSWITVTWSMSASACLTLAVMYFLMWFKNRVAAHLLFAITAASFSAFAFFELRIMQAQTPQQLDAALRWGQVPMSIGLLSLMWFVSSYLDAGRRWLGWTICGLRALHVVPSLVFGGNPNILSIATLEHSQFLGESITIVRGTPNPWGVIGLLTILLILVFVGDASVTAWRRGNRRKALMVGSSVVFILSAGFLLSAFLLWLGFRMPVLNSMSYLALVVVMGYELSRDVLRASQLAQDLRTSEVRSQAILRAVPDLMFLQSIDGVYLDYHASRPDQLFVPPDYFLGKNMREVLPPTVLSAIGPAFELAVSAAEPVVVEYELPMSHGPRTYEARLVRNEHDQILTVVRDVTESRRAQAELRESQAILQASHREIHDLAGRLIASQEVERARIARDLHDDLSQQIAGLSIALSSLKRNVGGLPGAGDLHDAVAALQQRAIALAEQIRSLSHDLHPSVLEHAGLVAALNAYCADLERQQSLPIAFTAEGDFASTSPTAALCLYRVAQEGLRNVVTHARAAHAEVRLLQIGESAELIIADDGRGFDIASASAGHALGLVSINERVRLAGGTVSIVSEVNKGTRLHVHIPANGHVVAAPWA